MSQAEVVEGSGIIQLARMNKKNKKKRKQSGGGSGQGLDISHVPSHKKKKKKKSKKSTGDGDGNSNGGGQVKKSGYREGGSFNPYGSKGTKGTLKQSESQRTQGTMSGR